MYKLVVIALLASACSGGPIAGSDGSMPGADGGTHPPPVDAGPFDGGPVPDGPLAPMLRISDNVPSFASNGNAGAANDGNIVSTWNPDGTLPAWLAYDLSSVPARQRHQVLVSFNNFTLPSYVNDPTMITGPAVPADYTIEVNDGASAAQPPTDGWRTLGTITGNSITAREHVVDMGGANWIRIQVTRSMNADGTFELDMDVYDASGGFIDGWLQMGDSITYITFSRWTSHIVDLLAAEVPDYTPYFDCAALGGTNSGDGQGVLDAALPVYPGHFITINYGTNDGDPTSYHANMQAIAERIIAAGKAPVIPLIPWPHDAPGGTHDATVQALNAQLELLFAANPQIIRGPDLYTLFSTHPEYIAEGDVHPNDMGRMALQQAWADWMTHSIYGH